MLYVHALKFILMLFNQSISAVIGYTSKLSGNNSFVMQTFFRSCRIISPGHIDLPQSASIVYLCDDRNELCRRMRHRNWWKVLHAHETFIENLTLHHSHLYVTFLLLNYSHSQSCSYRRVACTPFKSITLLT